MTALDWHKVGDRVYEQGLDRGVLYVEDEAGVPWNGLIAIDETIDNDVEPVYFDGLKFNDSVVLGTFSGVIRAFTYPDEFLRCEGILEDQNGLFLTGQPHKRFNLSYRTRVQEDTSGVEGYKIHLLYNVTAVPTQKTRKTLGFEPEAAEFSWDITTVPEDVEHYRPTAHIIIDSRNIDPWLMADIETILYGSEDRDPTMPSLKAFTTFIRKWDRLIIIDNGDGTWTAISRDDADITMVSSIEFIIEAENVTYLDAETYTIASTNKNEEDI